MNFDLSSNQKKFLSKVDTTCQSIREEEEKSYIKEKRNDRLISEFNKIGMLGCPISRKYGGLGYDILTYLLALERVGEEGSSIRTFFSAHTSIGQMVIQNWGNEEQKKKYLPKSTTGKNIMAFALTEPSAGSDPSLLETKYEESGDHFILNGRKHWIGNATIANIITTYAKEKTSGKISAFIVDMNSLGIETKEMKNKIGLLTVTNGEISFKNCKIPKENLLGNVGQGLSIALSALIDGRLSVSAGSVGVIQDCILESISYSKIRTQHGSVLAKKQLIQNHIAKMIIALESSKWLTYKAATSRMKFHKYLEELKKKEKNWINRLSRDNKTYTSLRKDADKYASIAKYYTSNAAFDVSNTAVQIFGSKAYQKTARVARHFIDTRATMIYEGANEVLKLKIASDVLGEEYKSY